MSLLDARVTLPTPVGKLYTEEDLEQMDSDARYELIRGELCAMPNNSAEHGNKTARLSGPVIVYVEDNDLGECFAAETRFTIAKNPDTTIGPDFAFIAKERLTGIPPRGYLHLVPDLVVETRSPGDTHREFALKVSQWIEAGARLVWALDPSARTLTIHRPGVDPVRLTIDDTLSGEDVLPGFTLPLRRLFREVTKT